MLKNVLEKWNGVKTMKPKRKMNEMYCYIMHSKFNEKQEWSVIAM